MFYVFTTPSPRGLSLSISLPKKRAAQQPVAAESVVAPATNSFCSFRFTFFFRHSLNFRQKADEAYPVPQAGHAHIGRNYALS